VKRKWTLPAIAAFGILFGILMVAKTTKPVPKPKMIVEPSKAPFTSYVSGAGLIEASTENVKVGTTTGGLVTKVLVKVGDSVSKGQPLFQIDAAVKQAELAQYEASLRSAEASLDKLRKGSRPEAIAMQEEQVRQAATQLQDAQEQLKLREAAYAEESRAISQDDLNQARNNVSLRQAALSYQQQHLQELKNGTWAPEIKIQEAAVASAKAQVQQARTEIERMTVRSPLDGQVLQVKIHAGEYAPAAQTDDALIMVGSDDTLSIRVDIDEQDAWRVETGESAVAYPRGRSDVKIPLAFARVEPYVVPKKSLTGRSSERVDTRVLQVVYNFQQPRDFHLYLGQQMDVFIQADSLPDPGMSSSGGAPAKGGRQ
jgi:multidrug efflux pump subunit AcrA (membrane-fusion protein)